MLAMGQCQSREKVQGHVQVLVAYDGKGVVPKAVSYPRKKLCAERVVLDCGAHSSPSITSAHMPALALVTPDPNKRCPSLAQSSVG